MDFSTICLEKSQIWYIGQVKIWIRQALDCRICPQQHGHHDLWSYPRTPAWAATVDPSPTQLKIATEYVLVILQERQQQHHETNRQADRHRYVQVEQCHIILWGEKMDRNQHTKQNSCYFTDIFKYILLNENFHTGIEISLKFVPKGPIDNNSALVVQAMAWCPVGGKALYEFDNFSGWIFVKVWTLYLCCIHLKDTKIQLFIFISYWIGPRLPAILVISQTW